jgi:beta-galactosidase
MKKLVVLLFVFSAILAGCSNSNSRRIIEFNGGWRFNLGDVEAAQTETFDDSGWRQLNLPHDWAIEGSFSEANPAGAGGGALPGGIGWYRKHFTVDQLKTGQRVFVDFDGVYMNSSVFVNGTLVGTRPNGYISFRYDITDLLHEGENTIAVKVDNQLQPNSRWYSGCGIYRNVWLTIVNPVYVEKWGTYVTTPVVDAESATMAVTTSVFNSSDNKVDVEIRTSIINRDGRKVASQSSPLTLDAQSSGNLKQTLPIDKPVLWDIDNPYLYKILTEVVDNGKVIDNYNTTAGIRTFRFDAKDGFYLNGKNLKIKGVCMHHDLGALGSAINTRAIERQLQILREMGCNSIRTSHNPPAPELLDLCDKMGFIVQDETFDMWRKKKTAYDYSLYFNEWHERDLTDHILRDRNHPSVMMWSIGNEVLEQWTHEDADTLDIRTANLLLNFKRDPSSLAQEGEEMSINSMLTVKLANIVRDLDSTRPITAGNNEPNPYNHLFRAKTLDLIGYNYHEEWFDDVPTNFPGKPFIITESTSALATRGYYRMPSDSMFIWPARWDLPFSDPSFSCSSYDNNHVPWGTTHEESWRLTKKNSFISGLYVWTGFDYLGEPTPYWFPARSSYFGIVDLAGFPKDVYYMYQSEWTDKTMLHLFPHWNWESGQEVDLWAYYNQADEVELFVNGKSQGVRKKENDSFHVSWRVKFEPGTVKAVARKDGKEVISKEINTASQPAKIRLTADRNVITSDGKDLSFVTVEVTDENGNLVPYADNLINFDIEGAGFIAGVDNGSQTSMESFKANFRKAFYGKCLVIIQNNGKSGNITLQASSDKLKSERIVIRTSKHI